MRIVITAINVDTGKTVAEGIYANEPKETLDEVYESCKKAASGKLTHLSFTNGQGDRVFLSKETLLRCSLKVSVSLCQNS